MNCKDYGICKCIQQHNVLLAVHFFIHVETETSPPSNPLRSLFFNLFTYFVWILRESKLGSDNISITTSVAASERAYVFLSPTIRA